MIAAVRLAMARIFRDAAGVARAARPVEHGEQLDASGAAHMSPAPRTAALQATSTLRVTPALSPRTWAAR
jgi:hypothetical protein